MGNQKPVEPDFRFAQTSKKPPRAVADSVGGMLLALAEVPGTAEQVFSAVMTSEVEHWWTMPGVYRLKDWTVELRAQGRWSVTVDLPDGRRFNEWGEICEVDPPRKVVMTRRFAANPLIGERETTLTYRFEPSTHGTLVTVREEGFIGRPEAARGNAENWEKVLNWLDAYLSERQQ